MSSPILGISNPSTSTSFEAHTAQRSSRRTGLAVDTSGSRSPLLEFGDETPNPYLPSNLKSRSDTHFPPSQSPQYYSQSGSSRSIESNQGRTKFGLGLSSGRESRDGGKWRRGKLWVLIVTLLVFLTFGMSKGRETLVKQKLTTRWWNSRATSRQLPKPHLPPKRPLPKPPSINSHSLAQLNRLSSTFSRSSPDYTAIVFLSPTIDQNLPTLIKSLKDQEHSPLRILVIHPVEYDTPSLAQDDSISLLPYPIERLPALAILHAAQSITTDYVLVINTPTSPLPSSYVRTLLRAAGTQEYSSALLAAGGIVLPSNENSTLTCSTDESSVTGTRKTQSLHFPSTPFLLEKDWLTSLSNGLRTDLPLEIGIGLALWGKLGIPSFGLPLSIEEEASKIENGCTQVSNLIKGDEFRLGKLFRNPFVGKKSIEDTEESSKPQIILMLLSGDEELELAHPLACGLAASHDLRLYLTDSKQFGQKVFFPPSPDGTHGRCHLDIRALEPTEEESISSLLVIELERMENDIEVVFYLRGGERDREFGEVLKWAGGVFGFGQGGKRMSREEMDVETGMVVIGIEKDDIGNAEWISALPIESLRHWHTPSIDLSIITNNRPASLSRLLMSLRSSHYFSDQVGLSINLEQTSDRETQALVDNFPWQHGPITLRHRIILGGLMPAIVESWYPSSNDSYGVFLEDDIELSPYFYSWLKFNVLYYRYYTPARESSFHLFGISLYQQRVNELRPTGRAAFDAHTLLSSINLPSNLPYLSQIPCSWGAIYFPEIWREFHGFLALRLSEQSLAISDFIVPEIRSNRWPRSWKKYFIELVFLRGYTMLYPNYIDFISFSTNHLEKGEHASIVDQKRRAQFQVPLMNSSSTILNLPENRLPTWNELPIIDLWGSLTTEEEIIERGWQSATQMELCPFNPLRIDGELTFDSRELLCPREYERSTMKNLRDLEKSIPHSRARPTRPALDYVGEVDSNGMQWIAEETGPGHVHVVIVGDEEEDEEGDEEDEEWEEGDDAEEGEEE